jgi:hypothetical protein
MAMNPALRTPRDVALMLRETAKRIAARPGDDLLLSPEAQAAFAILFRAWADTLDETPDPERVTDQPGELPLAVELDNAADALAGDAALGGDGGVMLSAGDARELVAWLRRSAWRAARLYVAAKGFQFVPVADLDAPPKAELTGDAARRRAPAPHPDDIVPGLRTGTGNLVSHEHLEWLRRHRRAAGGGLPCDVEDNR